MAKRISPTEFEQTCQDGEIVVREGDRGREMFVIRSGRVQISKRIDGRDVDLAVLEQGDFFGEMSLLEDMPRDASARAIGDTRLLVIQPGALLIRIRRDPTFAYEMLQRMSGRIRDLNAWVARALAAAPAGEAAADDAPAEPAQPLLLYRSDVGLEPIEPDR